MKSQTPPNNPQSNKVKRRRNFNAPERYALFVHANGKCQKCGLVLDDTWEADHVIPFSKGGQTILTNGQALCRDCNRKKGNKDMFEKPNVKMRDWQKEALEKFQGYDEQWFTLVATPGAGKTITMLLMAFYALQSGRADFIVVVTPSETLKYQWKDKARKLFGLLFKSEFNHHATKEYDGICVTYHYLARTTGKQAVKDLAKYKGRIFTIFDEPHHMANGRNWGDSAKYALGDSTQGVLGTGTLFRSDNYQIPFVTYDDNLTVETDYNYGYDDGLVDEVVRAIFFRKIDTEASWYSYTDEIMTDVSFYDDVDKRQISERLNATIHPNSEFVQHVLKQSYAELVQIRQTEQTNAKGLIICKDVRHAEQIADAFLSIHKTRPIIVSSDDEHGNKNDIESFKTNNEMFIIAVDMISEGVDIPPLRALVYLTNKTAPLYFYQAIGRVVRVEKGLEKANGYVYLPSDERLLKLAHDIKERRNHVLKYIIENDDSDDEGKEPRCPPSQETFFEPISAVAVDDGGIYDADGYSVDEIERAKAFILENGSRITVEECAKILRITNAMPQASQSEVSELIPPDPEQKQKDLRKMCNRLAWRLGKMQNYDNPQDIHKEWVFNHNGNWQSKASNEELERKVIWLKARLNGQDV